MGSTHDLPRPSFNNCKNSLSNPNIASYNWAAYNSAKNETYISEDISEGSQSLNADVLLQIPDFFLHDEAVLHAFELVLDHGADLLVQEETLLLV